MPVAHRYVQDMRSVEKLRDAQWWAGTLAPLRGSAAAAAAAAAISRAAAGGAGVQQVRRWAPLSTYVVVTLVDAMASIAKL